MKKIHALRMMGESYSAGSRTVCRYSSRPSRRVRAVPALDFLQFPQSEQCEECRKRVAPNGVIRAQILPGKWANIPVRENQNMPHNSADNWESRMTDSKPVKQRSA